MSAKNFLRNFATKISRFLVDLSPKLTRMAWMSLPEPIVARLSGFQCLAHPGETVVLAGVWRASTVAAWADRVGPRGRVIAIEANPTSAEELRRSFAAQANIQIVNVALLDQPRKVSFAAFEGDYHGFDSVITDDSRFVTDPVYTKFRRERHARTIEVEGTSLDKLLTDLKIKKVDVIFMTINGVELPALRGAEEFLDNATDLRLHVTTQFSHDEARRVAEFLGERGWYTRIYTRPTDRLINVIAI